ncbi:hypothetical protein Cgig2_000580 [Carnegiea gigantea]|uniref:KAT8 regulatory NSL complex subunit 2 n=1 Tax=Carnegiea gigantea TaxID=171969 RepID=A0A9Q1GTK7_9CARY|nr:hypothetical protein Cgig2_000580 [Carnegiea gigantea]
MKAPPALVDSNDEDALLANSEVLTREEVLRRKARLARLHAKLLRKFFWYLMEDLRRKHREYYWNFGKSPFLEDEVEKKETGFLAGNVNLSNGDHGNGSGDGDVDGSDGKLGLGFPGKCLVDGCASKAMPLTKYCHPHILTGSGAIQCSKPILVSTIPSLCSAHVQKMEKAIKQALKKGGVSVSSSAKLAPKFQYVISEYVRNIQNRRRAAAAAARCGLLCDKDISSTETHPRSSDLRPKEDYNRFVNFLHTIILEK